MKITGPTAPGAPSSARPSRPAAGFSLGSAPSAGAAGAAAPAASTAGVSDVSALMALQGVEGPQERRRRAVKRGGGLLDRLDELKLALLGGEADEATLQRLSRALQEDRPEAGEDAGLNAVLDEIDLRASVELAKADMRRADRRTGS